MTAPTLAVSDSPLARSLLRDQKLTVPLETGGPLTVSAVTEFPTHRWLLHNSVWDWSLAHPQALEQTFGRQDVMAATKSALEQTQAPWLSMHLGYSAAHVTFQKGQQPVSEVLGHGIVVERLIHNITALKAAINVPLLLENLDYNATGAYEHICEPVVIRTVLEATDTYLLLDLAHAQVSASRLGVAQGDYLAQLPLARVKQLHVSSPRPVGETLTDVHETLRPVDYGLLESVLEQTDPWAVTLEYRRDAAALRTQLERLRGILNS